MTREQANARFEKYVPKTFKVAHHEGCSDAVCPVTGGIDLIISAGNYNNACQLSLVTKKGREIASYPEEVSEKAHEKSPVLRLEKVDAGIATFLRVNGFEHLIKTVLDV